MAQALRVVAGLLLLGHGAVHLLFLLRADGDERYPFALHRSPRVPARVRRVAGTALAALVVLASAGLALAVWGVPWLGPGWPVLAVVAGLGSLVLVALARDRRLLVGVVIDLALLALAAIRPDGVVP